MLKLPKGLKKKKKGKKSKKDQELFTEEELEQYKREQKLKEQNLREGLKSTEEGASATEKSDTEPKSSQSSSVPASVAATSTQSVGTEETNSTGKVEADEEWLKFKVLTSGVDSIIHKTQDDLDRIKSKSFYQRVPTPAERQKAEEEERAKQEVQRLEEERRKAEEAEANRDKLAEAIVELSESEDESEDADDIFETEYIDAITSGELQLAVVPDSPELEFDDGPDPFDTSYADKLIKGPEVSKRGKKLVNIGAAVEVLTGRVESVKAATGSLKKKPRRGIQNLLFDEDEEIVVSEQTELTITPEPPKTLLDDLADDIPDIPIDLSVSLHLSLLKQKPEEKCEELEGQREADIVSEFDVLKDDEDDEFAELAAESLTKKEEVVVIKKEELRELTQPKTADFEIEVPAEWAAELEEQKQKEAAESAKKAKPPRPPAFRPNTAAQESEDEFEVPEDDPFDTTFVGKVLPVSKCEEDDDFDFDPRAEENKSQPLIAKPVVDRDLLGGSSTDLSEVNAGSSNLLTTSHKDLLAGSTTDLSSLPEVPINPVLKSDEKPVPDEDFDPFDTSAVTNLVKPKEAELKFLEKELLSETSLKHSLSDPDFDPRAEEPIPATVAGYQTSAAVITEPEFDPARRKSSLSLNIQQKSVGFLVPDNDLLADSHDTGKIQKPLTPYYSKEETIQEKDSEDPFDTSFVPETKPTAVELNLLEEDLLTNTNLKHSLSDPDFDPRADDRETSVVVNSVDPKSDLLGAEDQINIKVLTPAHETKDFVQNVVETYGDPFDTSNIDSNILPGKTELKLIENELIPAAYPEVQTGVLDTLTDAQELGLGDKVLTPQVPIASGASIEEVDPFDTSFAENLRPGKTEIKLLENELIEQ